MEYILRSRDTSCVFCDRENADDDEAGRVVRRAEHVFTVLNIYPYTVGHIMICPFRHVARWLELTDAERVGLLVEAKRAESALKKVYAPEIIHLGLNMGRPGGAGIEEHLHLHLVPWRSADALDNPQRADIETLPESLDETYRKLLTAFAAMDA